MAKIILPVDKIICGDCEDVLKRFPDNCIDLIVTSPPYANKRMRQYGGAKPDEFVDWFLPKSGQFFRVLKEAGTFILNIAEITVKGAIHPCVLRLQLALEEEQGWIRRPYYIWHKKNCMPCGGIRNAWEFCLRFSKSMEYSMYPKAVMVPPKASTVARARNPSKNDGRKVRSGTGSGFTAKVSNCVKGKVVYPTNVLHLAAENRNQDHSAAFPIGLPKFFIMLFTKPGDVVLDPFAGSATTMVAAKKLKRRSVGIDKDRESCIKARKRFRKG